MAACISSYVVNTILQQQFLLISEVYTSTHGCVDRSFFIHMVFLKPHYSLCILSNKPLQMIYDEFLMIGFLTSFGGDFSAIHQSLSDQSNNLIINSSKKLHSQTLLCVRSRSQIQDDVNTCSAASSIAKKKKRERNIPGLCISLIFKILFL